MKHRLVVAITIAVGSGLLLAMPALAKRDANDPRRLCREQIQKANGLAKDAKVSRKELDRCVANGGKI